MTDRSDRIWLPADEPRCAPAVCHVRMRCARTMASIPQGTPLQDYSNESGGGTVLCPGFVTIDAARRMREDAGRAKAEARPWPGG